MRIPAIAFLLICCRFCLAQPAHLAFDVASVKPQKWTGSGSVGVFIRGNTLDAEHADLNSLVEFAYNIQGFQLSGGPAWAAHGKLDSSELFQVVGKPAEGQTPAMDQFRLMLQTLLDERFHLQVHHETKPFPAWNLVVNKGGPKLKETTGGERALNVRNIGPSGVHIDATNTTIQQLVEQVGFGRPVFEKTGLAGHYDFSLEWSDDPTGVSDAPTLSTALQDQLGLKLEPITAPFDTVVIDHAEKPSEN